VAAVALAKGAISYDCAGGDAGVIPQNSN
jgi:hypothetical protein